MLSLMLLGFLAPFSGGFVLIELARSRGWFPELEGRDTDWSVGYTLLVAWAGLALTAITEAALTLLLAGWP